MNAATTSAREGERAKMSLPVVALTTLGILIAVIGVFAAGDMVVVSIGLGAIFAAGIIELGERLIERNTPR